MPKIGDTVYRVERFDFVKQEFIILSRRIIAILNVGYDFGYEDGGTTYSPYTMYVVCDPLIKINHPDRSLTIKFANNDNIHFNDRIYTTFILEKDMTSEWSTSKRDAILKFTIATRERLKDEELNLSLNLEATRENTQKFIAAAEKIIVNIKE